MYSGKILAENAVAAGQWESGKKRGFSVPAVDMRRTGKRMLPGMSESGEKGWSSRRGSWKDNYYFAAVDHWNSYLDKQRLVFALPKGTDACL